MCILICRCRDLITSALHITYLLYLCAHARAHKAEHSERISLKWRGQIASLFQLFSFLHLLFFVVYVYSLTRMHSRYQIATEGMKGTN
jgi:hypothetical protein